MPIIHKPRPSLTINGIVVYFDSHQDHSNYVIHETLSTQREYREYNCASPGHEQRLAKRRLDLARQNAYHDWLQQKGK